MGFYQTAKRPRLALGLGHYSALNIPTTTVIAIVCYFRTWTGNGLLWMVYAGNLPKIKLALCTFTKGILNSKRTVCISYFLPNFRVETNESLQYKNFTNKLLSNSKKAETPSRAWSLASFEHPYWKLYLDRVSFATENSLEIVTI